MCEDGALQGLNVCLDFYLPLFGSFDDCFEALGALLIDFVLASEAEISAYLIDIAPFCWREGFEIISY